jgi:heme exporter protein D
MEAHAMARGTSKLSAVAVAKAKKPGRYADGNGLYLQVGPTGTKSWLFRYMINGRAREMGLGPVSLIPLAEARVAALETRRKVHEGIDPLAEREEQQRQARIEQARAMTFSQCADAYIQAHRSSWRNDKHAAQWESTLKSYAAPVIGAFHALAVDNSGCGAGVTPGLLPTLNVKRVVNAVQRTIPLP